MARHLLAAVAKPCPKRRKPAAAFPLAALLFDLMNPLTVRLTGTNINRDTVGNVRRAGFTILREENLLGKTVKLIEAEARG